jgi:DNA-binding NarL/FixJ family response regulator
MRAKIVNVHVEATLYRVAIVECQVLFAKALSAILTADPELAIVGEYRTALASRLEASRPDLVVLDIDGQVADIERDIAICAELDSRPRVCVLSIHALPEIMQRCLSAGAHAYIVKDTSPAEIVSALKMVGRGHSYVDPRVAGGLLRKRSQNGGKPDIMELSRRETEVLKLIAEALTNKQISARLGLSEKTVKNHIGRIFSKLNISARTEAAVYAIRTGIV